MSTHPLLPARRSLLRAAAGVTLGSGALAATTGTAAAGSLVVPGVLQPGCGPRRGAYVASTPGNVLWGHLPNRDTAPSVVVSSGDVVTLDTVSHEGILEDQGKDPRGYFSGFGVAAEDVLDDAVAIAAQVPHDGPGPHVVTRPVAVDGAVPGDVLKVEVLDLALRVPYGVISNRHGKGALPGELPEKWVGNPLVADYFNVGGNISVFTSVATSGGGLVGALPGPVPARFPLAPFLGTMGVARDTSAMVDSVPPTDAGGNMDVKDLVVGSTLYLPVRVPGAMFFVGDPHMAQGDGEVSLTAMEGSLRATVRLSIVRPGEGGAPRQTREFPFAETPDHWIPMGLSDPDGPLGEGQGTDLDVAVRDAVRHALDFLTSDLGMPEPVAYAYLSAATDFHLSQVVDRTVGVHATIRKSDFPS
ncbi:acetamidase/formamidase family protein [Kineococcus sp. SYSU DK002]|uniref:acetamidase/formamidase family protein n=1 Tax=Kineococcus sp. SYSU DK002 TaxID=3383123 RepID=UPI003D7DE2B1